MNCLIETLRLNTHLLQRVYRTYRNHEQRTVHGECEQNSKQPALKTKAPLIIFETVVARQPHTFSEYVGEVKSHQGIIEAD